MKMTTRTSGVRTIVSWTELLLAVCALVAPWRAHAVGTWTTVGLAAPGNVELILLLSDGTVMAQQQGTSSGWYRLTPDNRGSYAKGTWSTLASMHYPRI